MPIQLLGLSGLHSIASAIFAIAMRQAVGIFRSKDGGIARDLERYLAESGFGED